MEFALILPLFLTLLFGTMEAGWLFAQQVEVRNAAREGARIAAVSAPDITGDSSFTADDVVKRSCDALDLSSGGVTVTLTANGSDVGDSAVITLTSTYASLTTFLDPIFGGLVIDTDVEFRLEQPKSWNDIASVACP